VPTVAVDSVLAAAGWPKLAGVKLDVEGAEYAVLGGARETLKRNPRAFIMFEVSGRDHEKQAVGADALQLLESLDYRFRRLQNGAAGSLLSARDLQSTIGTTTRWQDSLVNVVAEKT
jgi:hypothetical protein